MCLDVRVRGYCSKPKGVGGQKILGNSALDYSSVGCALYRSRSQHVSRYDSIACNKMICDGIYSGTNLSAVGAIFYLCRQCAVVS